MTIKAEKTKSPTYSKLMDTKKGLQLIGILLIIIVSSCYPYHYFETSAKLKVEGKISATIYPENKTTFKVGDSIRIFSKFNASDLDHWRKYNKINNDLVVTNMVLVNPINIEDMIRYGISLSEKDSGSYLSKEEIDKHRYFISHTITGNKVPPPPNNPVTIIHYKKQKDGGYALEIVFYFTKAGDYYVGGITPNYNDATYNRYEAATEEERKKGVRAQLYIKSDHAAVPVVFTNNNKNYFPITVTE